MKIPKLICFDVGARNGLKDLRSLSRSISLYSFEPNLQDNDSLINGKGNEYTEFHLIKKGLYSSPGIYNFYLTTNPSMSSMYKPDKKILNEYFNSISEFKEWRKQLNIIGEKKVETITVDDFVKERGINFIDYLKLDTQGTELEILKGAENSLKEKNQPTFTQIDQYLNSHGYKLITCEFNYDQSYFSGKHGEKPKWGIGGDAYYCINSERMDGTEKILRMGVVIGALGFISNSANFFNAISISEEDQKQFFKSTQIRDIKKATKFFFPPILINLYKRLFRK
jgi:FkbM family methyltransferase